MAKCLNCGSGKGGRSRKSKNWRSWQLCYECAKELHPKEYENEHPHGIGGRGCAAAKHEDFLVVNPNQEVILKHTSFI